MILLVRLLFANGKMNFFRQKGKNGGQEKVKSAKWTKKI